MKIVFLTPDRIVDRRIILEGRSLVSRGHEVTIIADLGNEQDDASEPSLHIKNVLSGGNPGGLTAHRLLSMKDRLKKALGGSPHIRKLVRKAYFSLFFALQSMKPPAERKLHPIEDVYYGRACKENAGIYVACDLPMLQAAYRASLSSRSILVYDAHEFYTEQKILAAMERMVSRDREKALIAHASLVITVNDSIASLFQKHYGIKKPEVIYNCTTPPPQFERGKKYNRIREKLALPESVKVLLFQGGYLQGRNLANLVKSAQYLKENCAIVLLGFGEYRAYLEQLARRHGSGKVFFLEAVSQTELLSHSASADLGIIPYEPVDLNTRFCTPNKLFEFMQAGLPVLAEERLDELKSFISREKTGFLRDLSTPGSIARAVNELMADDEALQKARSRCHEIAGVYNWDREGSRFADLIEGLLKGDRQC